MLFPRRHSIAHQLGSIHDRFCRCLVVLTISTDSTRIKLFRWRTPDDCAFGDEAQRNEFLGCGRFHERVRHIPESLSVETIRGSCEVDDVNHLIRGAQIAQNLQVGVGLDSVALIHEHKSPLVGSTKCVERAIL